MKRFRVHKTSGTTKMVTFAFELVEADVIEFSKGGAISFWNYPNGHLVMAYPPTAWKSVYQEEEPND